MANKKATVDSRTKKETITKTKSLTAKQIFTDLNKVCNHTYYKRLDWHVVNLEFEVIVYRRNRNQVMAIFWQPAPNRDAHLSIDDVELNDAIKTVGSERIKEYIKNNK